MRLTTVCLLSTLLLLTYARFPQQNAMRFEPQQADLRTLIVTVTDKNNAPIDKLEAASFTVTLKKISQEVVEVRQIDSPLSVAIVLDLSASMGTHQGRASKLMREALNAVKSFVDLSHPANGYFVIGFNEKAMVLTDPFQNAEATKNDLSAMSSRTFFKGRTALFDAIHLAVNTLSLGTNARRAILLITDGQDSNSFATFKETARLLERKDILVYPVNIASDESTGSALGEEGRSILEEFASLSGGRYVQPKETVELRILLGQVAAELRAQYLVRFRRAATLKNECDEFKVKVTVSPRKTLNSRVRKIVCDL